MCVCVHVYVCLFMYGHSKCSYICMFVCVCRRRYVHCGDIVSSNAGMMCVCVHVYVFVHVRTCVCM